MLLSAQRGFVPWNTHFEIHFTKYPQDRDVPVLVPSELDLRKRIRWKYEWEYAMTCEVMQIPKLRSEKKGVDVKVDPQIRPAYIDVQMLKFGLIIDSKKVVEIVFHIVFTVPILKKWRGGESLFIQKWHGYFLNNAIHDLGKVAWGKLRLLAHRM